MSLSALLLPVFFLVGIAASYEDARYGKIRNKWIILGIVWVLVVYFSLFVFNLISHDYRSVTVFLPPLLNGLIALAAGFFIWRAGKWSAGDAKLFFVFSLLLPLEYYQNSYVPFFPSLVLLINILILLLLFLIFKSVFYLLVNIYLGEIKLKNLRQNAFFHLYQGIAGDSFISMAIWIFLGGVITLILKGSVLSFLWRF